MVAGEDDPAAALDEAAGFDAARVPDHAALQLVCCACGKNHQAAGGLHRVAVFHQRGHRRRGDAQVGEGVVGVELQLEDFARGQGHGAHLRDDDALVAHFGREQRDVAAQGCFQFAFVDDAASRAVAREAVATGHEVGIADAVGGGHQAAHIDTGTGRKVHAAGVG